MALFTSTPKRKAAEKTHLLAPDNDDDNSSGYDSPVYTNESDDKPKVARDYRCESDDSDSDFSSLDDSRCDSCDSSSDDDLDDLEDTEVGNDSMKVTNTKTLLDNMRYILSMPDLCDVTFLVGPQRIPVHGLKSILGTRSTAFFSMFLRQSKLKMNDRKKAKKNGVKGQENNKTTLIIDSYDVDVFRSFILFLHCGSVTMDVTTVTGLHCCATEFDISELNKACLEFINCLPLSSLETVVKETYRYGDHIAAQELRQNVSEQQQNNTVVSTKVDKLRQRPVPIGKETVV